MKQIFTNLKVLLTLLLLCGVSNVWAESYTLTFKVNKNDGTSVTSTTPIANILSEGANYVSSIDAANLQSVYYAGASGLKLGKSGGEGALGFNLSAAGHVTATTIVVSAKQYNSSKAANISVNGATAQSLGADFQDYTFTINSDIDKIVLNSNNYCWVKSVTVNYTVSSAPSISASDVTLESDATSGEIAYTISNPIENVSLTAETNVDWITIGSITETAVQFTTTENTTGANREGTITLKYEGADDKVVTVKQKKAGNPYEIDFESETSDYDAWTFTNMDSKNNSSITAHGGSYFGTTGGKATASIVTKEKIATPQQIKFYISKTSNNATASNWYVSVSSDNENWTKVGEDISATSMSKGDWDEVTRDLSAYTDVYVKVGYSGSTAIRAIDDLTLTTEAPKVLAPTLPEECIFENSKEITITNNQTGATVYYTINGGDPVEYTAPFTITETSTVAAYAQSGEDKSATVTATYTFKKVYNGFEELVAANVTSGETVKVTFEDVEITDIYVNGSGKRNGIYLNVKGANGNDIEIYYYDVPEGWFIGGKVSGTMECPWKYYDAGNVWELAPASNSWSWDNLAYTAPAPVILTGAADASGFYYATFIGKNNMKADDNTIIATCFVENGKVQINDLDGDVIPANSPVLVYSLEPTITLTATAEEADAEDVEYIEDEDFNMLFGYTVDTHVATETGSYYYALNVANGNVGFFVPRTTDDTANPSAANGFTAKAGKAYLKVTDSVGVSGYIFNDATVIEGVAEKVNDSKVRVNLAGQVVNDSYKGIVIMNGKKVLNR